jgi:pseudaminic acid synthase
MTFRIRDRSIGPESDVFFAAELSANHNGRLERALAAIRAAAAAGADAVKLQTYTADTITIRSDRPEFTIRDGPWAGRTLHDLYDEAHTPWSWHPRLFEEARNSGIEIFSTPFDDSAVDFLETLGAPAYKIASFELVDDALLRKVASTGKPVIMSTGMATLEEITHAVGILEGAGASEIALLHCTSSYPAPDNSMNLLAIPLLAETSGKVVGLSDHSLGIAAPIAAVALGARLIEKHFTLSRSDGGPDSHFSLEPAELAETIANVRRAALMLGTAGFGAGVAEEGSKIFRRSLYIVDDVREGDLLTDQNVRSIRPGFGLSTRYRDVIIGHRATRDIARGTPLSWEHITK